jgi:exopolysaccharide biosynthesis polyprenyl glycosylphosphotransferase
LKRGPLAFSLVDDTTFQRAKVAEESYRAAPTEKERDYRFVLKRTFDICFSLLVMVIGAPLFALISLAIKLTSRGPIFFAQERLGKNGKPFQFYKFRTMYHKNDDSIHRRYSMNFINGMGNGGNGSNGGNGGSPDPNVFKITRDPRVTPVGRFLRRTSLDELPQFMNILKGDMSLVGPRPPVWYELEHYQEWHKSRLAATPGLTGLWQVSGRSTVPFDEMVKLDLYYIENWSLSLDLKIVCKTIPVVFSGFGAY